MQPLGNELGTSVHHSVKGHARARHVATDVTIVLDKSELVAKVHYITNDGRLVEQTKFGNQPQSRHTRHTSKEDQQIHGFDVVDFLPFQAFKAIHVDLDTNNDVKLGHDALKGCTWRIQHNDKGTIQRMNCCSAEVEEV